jgi:hypothetical protein
LNKQGPNGGQASEFKEKRPIHPKSIHGTVQHLGNSPLLKLEKLARDPEKLGKELAARNNIGVVGHNGELGRETSPGNINNPFPVLPHRFLPAALASPRANKRAKIGRSREDLKATPGRKGPREPAFNIPSSLIEVSKLRRDDDALAGFKGEASKSFSLHKDRENQR